MYEKRVMKVSVMSHVPHILSNKEKFHHKMVLRESVKYTQTCLFFIINIFCICLK